MNATKLQTPISPFIIKVVSHAFAMDWKFNFILCFASKKLIFKSYVAAHDACDFLLTQFDHWCHRNFSINHLTFSSIDAIKHGRSHLLVSREPLCTLRWRLWLFPSWHTWTNSRLTQNQAKRSSVGGVETDWVKSGFYLAANRHPATSSHSKKQHPQCKISILNMI